VKESSLIKFGGKEETCGERGGGIKGFPHRHDGPKYLFLHLGKRIKKRFSGGSTLKKIGCG